jgi:crotonobetainyl-CoA:carnitine CoA-transferase CaiB-like acyl-CoA transferase
MNMPLEGIKVLDLSRLLPGPFCSMILGDMGAEVLKIEDTKQGDPFRTDQSVFKYEKTIFLMINRNKRSMKLNLGTERGKAIFMQLVAEYDVLLEGFRPGVMAKLGLDYEQVRRVNPRMVYCSLTAYGQYGPYRDRPGHDLNTISLSGVLDAIGVRNGPPVIPGVQIGGIGGGAMWAAIAILAVLLGRGKNGTGQYLDAAIVDGLLPFHSMFAASYFADGSVPRRGETEASGACAYYNVYPTRDGRYVSLGAAEAKFWNGFCQAIGRPDLIPEQHAPEPRQSEIITEVRAIMLSRSQSEWVELLEPLDICFTPVKNLEEALADPHIKAREMVREVDHPVEGCIPMLAFPVKFSETPARIKSPSPLYGQHTEEVLQDLGYSEAEIEELHRLDVI